MAAQVSDHKQRTRALHPEHSFIVQAPAGSGKTELLIQRYLRLLATVDNPEEVIAITFTTKAAGEMRSRILESLQMAQDPAPEAEYKQLTWQLAQGVLQRDCEQGWELELNPTRLRIQTIDALCGSLARQMPLLSALGGMPNTVKDVQAQELYLEAARSTIRSLDDGGDLGDAVATLLHHLGNDSSKVEGMVAAMLAKRDQWLRHVADADLGKLGRTTLEQGLQRAITETLEELRTDFSPGLSAEFCELAGYAAANLKAAGELEHPLIACLDMQQMPGTSVEDMGQWLGLCELLLTKDGLLRKRVDKNLGFPTAKEADAKRLAKEWKDRLTQLIDQIRDEDELMARIVALRALPPGRYVEPQWDVLQALLQLLKFAVAHLMVVMSSRGEVDFIEMANRARMSLGSSEAPTDLALSLDYRIRHILVDEFQDTSFGQFELLSKLTAGWESGDGRTLFVVGDPMQSIYRFREADVGLYLQARRDGLGQIGLEPLTLSVNFRSSSSVVGWVNTTFAQVFPQHEDIAKGAVTYTPSEAHHGTSADSGVQLHPMLGRDDAAEAAAVVAAIAEARSADPEGSIAILVRGRTHLEAIVPLLRAEGLSFRAVEVEALTERPVIHDLTALTRAMLHPADRLSWLAVLRAPWCGLSLGDLLILAGGGGHPTLWQQIQDEERCRGLSDDGRERLRRLRSILQTAFSERRRRPLRSWIEGVWLALGGPSIPRLRSGLEEAQLFFELLQQCDEGGDLADLAALEAAIEKLFAPPDMAEDGASPQIEIMTMHKAKGLEFDTVILPGLGRPPKRDDSQLLQWLERHTGGGGADLLLAPIKGVADGADDPIYSYLKGIEGTKARFEQGRLLYVAATRARKRLHLLAHSGYDVDKGLPKRPDAASLLGSLWPAVEGEFSQVTYRPSAEGELEPQQPQLRRLPLGWRPPELDPMQWQQPPLTSVEDAVGEEITLEFDWAGEAARHMGSVVHHYLQYIAEDGSATWNEERIKALRPAFRRSLAHSGVALELLEQTADRVELALLNTISDERGSWILSAEHEQARSEYALTTSDGEGVSNVVIDRTFIDTDGTRWIIDFKASSHEGGSREGFLDQEQERYCHQLENYAAIFRRIEGRPVKMGLYFPLLQGWRSWD